MVSSEAVWCETALGAAEGESHAAPLGKPVFNIVTVNASPLLMQPASQLWSPRAACGLSKGFISGLEKGLSSEFHKEVLYRPVAGCK